MAPKSPWSSWTNLPRSQELSGGAAFGGAFVFAFSGRTSRRGRSNCSSDEYLADINVRSNWHGRQDIVWCSTLTCGMIWHLRTFGLVCLYGPEVGAIRCDGSEDKQGYYWRFGGTKSVVTVSSLPNEPNEPNEPNPAFLLIEKGSTIVFQRSSNRAMQRSSGAPREERGKTKCCWWWWCLSCFCNPIGEQAEVES